VNAVFGKEFAGRMDRVVSQSRQVWKPCNFVVSISHVDKVNHIDVLGEHSRTSFGEFGWKGFYADSPAQPLPVL